MQDKTRKIKHALESITDADRPVSVVTYSPRKTVRMYRIYIKGENPAYRFSDQLVEQATKMLQQDEKTASVKISNDSIPLRYEDMLFLINKVSPGELYAPVSTHKEQQQDDEDDQQFMQQDEVQQQHQADSEQQQEQQEQQARIGQVDAEATPPVSLSPSDYSNAYLLNKAIEQLIASKGIQQANPQDYSAEEKAFISLYSGYGGLEKYGATGKEILYEYYTPEQVITACWKLAYKYGYKGGAVLEPAAGTGRMLKEAPTGASLTAYEISPYSAAILTILYPQAKVIKDGFETLFLKNRNTIRDKTQDLPKYDLVIGNPPYGEMLGRYAGMGDKDYTHAKNYIEYFIYRGLDVLNAGGLLIYIIGVEAANGGTPFLDQGVTKSKQAIASKAALIDAYRLPDSTFERTGVTPDVVVFQKL